MDDTWQNKFLKKKIPVKPVKKKKIEKNIDLGRKMNG